jgi:hypothetical protein
MGMPGGSHQFLGSPCFLESACIFCLGCYKRGLISLWGCPVGHMSAHRVSLGGSMLCVFVARALFLFQVALGLARITRSFIHRLCGKLPKE